MVVSKEGHEMEMPVVSPDVSDSDSDSRREFLKHVLSGAATATVLMVFGVGPLDASPKGAKGAKKAGHRYAYVINVNNCIGCGNCVRACKRENAVPSAVFRTWVERYVYTEDGIYVDSPNGALEGFEEVNKEIRDKAESSHFIPKMCNHCEEPPCVQVCPVGATFKSPEGFVLVDNEHCLGCAYCVQACPYGARFINPVKHVSDKCDWCYHRVKNGKLPACVTVCPNRARLFGDLNDADSEVTRIFHEDKWMVLRPHLQTGPTCFYVGLTRKVI
jgi:Fe-S-cluster-containing dehydrogenase component